MADLAPSSAAGRRSVSLIRCHVGLVDIARFFQLRLENRPLHLRAGINHAYRDICVAGTGMLAELGTRAVHICSIVPVYLPLGLPLAWMGGLCMQEYHAMLIYENNAYTALTLVLRVYESIYMTSVSDIASDVTNS